MEELAGNQFAVEAQLAEALAGEVAAEIGHAEGGDQLPGDVSRRDLIEIYSPVRDRDTGEVIAAAEFYYATEALAGDLAAAQRRSWLAVGGAALLIYFVLATFIRRVSDTIRTQQRALTEQVVQLTEVIAQNQQLHDRVRGAAARTAALNEQMLRRLSAELHDGPAQEISLALLRLDHVAAMTSAQNGDGAEIAHQVCLIEGSLRRSLQEVRAASSGLLLPHLASLTLDQTLDHVIRGHQRRTGAPVTVDDHPLFREGVAHTLRAQPDIEVVGEGESADEAIQIASDAMPDILLLDISMPGGGLEAVREIALAYPVVKIVMLTVSEAEDDVTAALRAGARAFVLKGVPARELVRILRAVAAGEVYVTPSLAASLLFEMTSQKPGADVPGPLEGLTEREREILELVAAGKSNKEVGAHLYISEKTVKHHITNILQKLQVRNRVEAAIIARFSEPPGR